MKRVCLLLLISVSAIGMGQSPDSLDQKGFKPKLIPDAATAEKVAKYKDSLNKDSTYPREKEPQVSNIPGNYDAIIELQKKQRAKQKRNAFIRIGIGVFFLIVLVIGLSRNLRSK